MNVDVKTAALGRVREDFVPAQAYISKEFVQLEKTRLWARVWQMACREEEIPRAGDFYTYDIADESISVVRMPDLSIAAYYNVCPHRGRRLTSGCGHMGRFHCKYHGWQWTLDGKSADVVDRSDWGNLLQDPEIELIPVKTGSWGGWVFINMDPDSETLEEFLEPAKAYLDPFEFDKMRYRWRRQIKIPANWKIAQEAFNEGYHVQTTHRQLLSYFDDMTYSRAIGKHGMFGYAPTSLFGLPSQRYGEVKGDLRVGLSRFTHNIWDTLDATTTVEMLAASDRLVNEVPEDAGIYEVYGAFAKFHQEEAAKNNRPFPQISVEQQMAAGTDWHIFPNMVFLQQPTNLLGYRARPNGDDPDSCIFDIYVLERFAPGAEPKVEIEYGGDWRTVNWGLILEQDFQNMEEIQKGMKSKGFRGARPSPLQERAISNFHETLQHYIEERN